MKNLKTCILISCAAFMAVFSAGIVPVAASDTDETTIGEDTDETITDDKDGRPLKMSHNIYMDPDISDGSGEYRAFQIDFYGDQTPEDTYWALCNWDMKGGFGAYSGLQNRTDGKKAILSFWEGEKDGATLRANRIFPTGEASNFGGEGDGTHWIADYNWTTHEWYRMLLYCWDDAETGRTFVGQWVKELSSGRWTLMSIFDTNLYDSAITGALSQFQENYEANTAYLPRSFRVKNIYAYDRINLKWLSLDKSHLSYDYPEWGFNTAGTHEFGSYNGYFWGRAGEYVSDQAGYDASQPLYIHAAIVQPSQPETEASSISDIKAENSQGYIKLSWNVDPCLAPVISTRIRTFDLNDVQTSDNTYTRPYINSREIKVAYSRTSKVLIDTRDVYGAEKSYSVSISTAADPVSEEITKTIYVPLKDKTACITIEYLPSTPYLGSAPKPEDILNARILVENAYNDQYYRYISARFKGSTKKGCGEASFYPELYINKKTTDAPALTKAEKKELKKTLKALNKAMKKDKCLFEITPRELVSENIDIRYSESKKGKVTIKKITMIIDLNGSEKKLKLSKKDYKAEINKEDRTITITGRRHFSGEVTMHY